VINSNLGFIWRRLAAIAHNELQGMVSLLLTVYRKSPAPYPMVPSPTPYDLLFS